MHEYFIGLLRDVSFDENLFMRELQKSRRWLNPDEYALVLQWVSDQYGEKYSSYCSPAESEYDIQIN